MLIDEIWSISGIKLEIPKHNCSLNNSISDVATLGTQLCTPTWFIRTLCLLMTGIIFGLLFYLCTWFFSGGCVRCRVYRCCCCCAINIHDTKAIENEVRRKWLRGIHTLTDSEDPFDVNDLQVSQLLLFFATYPGLRRLVGGRLVQYYAQPSAKPIKKSKRKRSHVVPVL